MSGSVQFSSLGLAVTSARSEGMRFSSLKVVIIALYGSVTIYHRRALKLRSNDDLEG